MFSLIQQAVNELYVHDYIRFCILLLFLHVLTAYIFIASSFFFFLDEILHVNQTVYTDFILFGSYSQAFLYQVCVYDLSTSI